MNAIETKNKFVERAKEYILTLPSIKKEGKKIFLIRSGVKHLVEFQQGMRNNAENAYLFINVWESQFDSKRIDFVHGSKFHERISFDVEPNPLYFWEISCTEEGIEKAFEIFVKSVSNSTLLK